MTFWYVYKNGQFDSWWVNEIDALHYSRQIGGTVEKHIEY
jgi:hypothetical protein